MVEANSCPSLCSRGQPTLPAPGAHGGASLAGAADSEAAVTRPGLELDTMTGEPRASRDPTERPPAPRGGGGAWASCPSHRAPTVARAQVPPGQLGRVSRLQRTLGRLLPERLLSTLAACLSANAQRGSEHRGLEGSRAGPLFLPRRAGASGRQVRGAEAGCPAGSPGEEPRASVLCAQWELALQGPRGPTQEREPPLPGPVTAARRRRARTAGGGPAAPESGGRRRDWKTSNRIAFPEIAGPSW